jgi:dipeptidyl aminopeptidase/acylaminoacyl peptidase
VVIDINLERTIEALRWLNNRAELKRKRVALCGVSRGAEQALILAALSARHAEIPKPAAVTALAATDHYVQGFSWNWQSAGGPEPDDPSARAWIWRGKHVGTIGKPIPIDRYDGPILLMHGVEDEIWAVERSRKLEKRLRKAERDVEAVYLPGEKHHLDLKRTACLSSKTR